MRIHKVNIRTLTIVLSVLAVHNLTLNSAGTVWAAESPHFAKASELVAKRKFKLAISEYSLALKETPDDINAYDGRASAYIMIGKPAKAVDDETKSLSIKKGYLAYLNRGSAYVELRDYDKAIADFEEARSLSPNEPIVYENIGLALYRKGDKTRSANAYAEALRLYKDAGLSAKVEEVSKTIKRLGLNRS